MKRSDWAIALAMVLCVVGLVACGGGGGSGSGGRGESASRENAGLEFAECMRAHGVEMEDPKPGQNIDLGRRANDPKTKVALAACNGKLGDAGQELSSDEDEELKEGAPLAA